MSKYPTKEMKNIFGIEKREDRKIKSWQGLARYIRHCLREQETPNANKDKTDLNFCLQGNSNDIRGTIEEYMNSKGLKINGEGSKNKSRIATELLISASPAYFYETEKNPDGSIKYVTKLNPFSQKEELQAVFKLDEEGNKILREKETMEWIYHNNNFLKERFGDDYTFGMVHLDETSPHISALITGTNYHNKWKKYQLSHSKDFGTGYKLKELHTEHAHYLNEHGITELNRGQERVSKADAQTIADGYNNLHKTIKEAKESELKAKQTKAKAIELLEDKDLEIEYIKSELDTTKVTSKKEIQARDRVIEAVAQRAGIGKEKVDKAVDRAREDVGLTPAITQDKSTGIEL